MQAQSELRANGASSELLYEELWESLPWGCLTLSPSGEIEEANTAAARALGTTRRELLGTRLHESIAEGHLGAYLDALSRSRAQGMADADVAIAARGAHKRQIQMKLHVRWFEDRKSVV